MHLKISFKQVFITCLGLFAIPVSGEWQLVKKRTMEDYGIFPMYFTGNGTDLYTGTVKGVFRSVDTGSTWQAFGEGLGETYISLIAVEDTVVCAGTSTSLFRINNAGKQWKALSIPTYSGLLTSVSILRSEIFVGRTAGVLRSADNGLTWTDQDFGLYYPDGKGFVVMHDTIHAGTSMGVYTSYDNGKSWISSRDVHSGPRYSTRSLVYFNKLLFAGTMDWGIFRSADHGATWIRCNAGLENIDIQTIVCDKDLMITATSAGVYISHNYGDSWIKASAGIKEQAILSLAVCNGMAVASTSEALWRRSLAELRNLNITEVTIESKYPDVTWQHPAGSEGSGNCAAILFNYAGARITHTGIKAGCISNSNNRVERRHCASGSFLNVTRSGNSTAVRRMIISK